MKRRFDVRGEVKIFPVENPWIYVSVPKKYTSMFRDRADRGLVAIAATIGNSSWNTSLMPMGDGTQFIPLNAKVRREQKIEIGDPITLFFTLRTH